MSLQNIQAIRFSNRQILILAGVIATLYALVEARGGGDLLIYLYAGADLMSGEDIFKKTYFDGYHYYYSLAFAWLLSPLWSLPFYWVKLTWLLLNLAMYAQMFHLLAKIEIVNRLDRRVRTIFLAGVFLFALRFLHENIHAGQVTILLLFCCVNGLRLIFSGRDWSGSALIAAAINLKLLPVVLLPYLVYRARWKAATIVVIIYAALFFVPLIALDSGYFFSLVDSWLGIINPGNTIHVLDVDERSFHSLSTLLATLLVAEVPDWHALPIRRHIAEISYESLAAVLVVVRLVFVAITLYFLRWPPFGPATNRQTIYAEVAYILLIVPLIFPHQQHYAFLFTVPAFAIGLFVLVKHYSEMSPGGRSIFSGALVFVYLCGNLKLLLGVFNAYYEHFKVLTYGTLVLVAVLLAIRRRFVKHLVP